MTTDPLQILRAELESLGMVVVPFRDELHVRLSTLQYIVVRVEDGRLSCEARVGAFRRPQATWTLAVGGSAAIAILLMSTGITPKTLAVAFVVIMSMIFNGVRHVLSDAMVTRIQMAWLNCRSRIAPAYPQAFESAGQPMELTEGRASALAPRDRESLTERHTPR